MKEGRTSTSDNHLEQLHRVVLAIKSQDGDTTYFRIARDKKIQSLFSTYCKEKNVHYNAVVFFHNGIRVKAARTPTELGLEDGDEIDAMVHQNGGGYAGNILNLS